MRENMSAPTFRTVCALMVLLCVTNITAHTIDDMKQLIKDKTHYDKKFRPVYYQNETVSVNVLFDLIATQEFNEVSEKFSVVGFLMMAWQDQIIAWDPKDYHNMTIFTADGADFWKPNLMLANPHGEVKPATKDWDIYRYHAKGAGLVSSAGVFDTGCSADITHYPWDEQECSLMFWAWGYMDHEVNISSYRETVGTFYFSGNGMWDLIGSSATAASSGDVSVITFTMRLQRKPRFVLVNVILPIVFMSFLNMIVFLIPTESGERMSYCLTVLLAIAVFLTLVGDNLPKTSTSISLLSYYLLGILAMSMGIVLMNVFSLRIYFHDKKNLVPPCLSTLVRFLSCKCKRRPACSVKQLSRKQRRVRYDTESDNELRHHKGRNSGVFVVNDPPVPHRNHSICTNDSGVDSYDTVSGRHPHEEDSCKTRSGTAESEGKEDDQVSWKDVSCVVDMLCFCLFVCALIGATTMFFVLTINKVNV